MPARDLGGDPIPVGKVRRELTFAGLVVDESPDWMRRVGATTERGGDIPEGRGELHLGVPPGEVGGYAFPAFDPDAFREVRLRAAVRPADLSPETTVSVGFADASAVESPAEWAYYRETGEVGSNGSVTVGSGDGGWESGTVGIALHDPAACGVLEVRVRPFERGMTVAFGGSDRGNVAFEDADLPVGFGMPTYPKLLVDAAESVDSRGGSAGKGSRDDVLALSKVQAAYIHD